MPKGARGQERNQPRPCHEPLSETSVRRRPTLPHPHECSTIGAGRLSFRVRNGTGRFPPAITAVTLSTTHTPDQPLSGRPRWVVGSESHSGCVARLWQALGLLVPVNSTRHQASISGLSTQSSLGGLTPQRVGDLI